VWTCGLRSYLGVGLFGWRALLRQRRDGGKSARLATRKAATARRPPRIEAKEAKP
jgi:hypothetical protein